MRNRSFSSRTSIANGRSVRYQRREPSTMGRSLSMSLPCRMSRHRARIVIIGSRRHTRRNAVASRRVACSKQTRSFHVDTYPFSFENPAHNNVASFGIASRASRRAHRSATATRRVIASITSAHASLHRPCARLRRESLAHSKHAASRSTHTRSPPQLQRITTTPASASRHAHRSAKAQTRVIACTRVAARVASPHV